MGPVVDPESGLLYLVNRYYDPSTAQYLSVDPAVGTTRQPYTYVADDPLNGTDPLGLCWPSWACGAEHAIGGAASATAGFVANHAGTIATVASVAALAVPGVDVIDLGVIAGVSVNGALALGANAVAIGAGGIASGEDFSQGHYVSGALDVVGTLGGLGALHLQGVANLNEFAASGAWRSSYLQPWLLDNAAAYAKAARITAFGAFGLGSIPGLGSFFSGLPAWAATCG